MLYAIGKIVLVVIGILIALQTRQEKKTVDMSDNEKAILEILKKEKMMSLIDLKSQSGLSNKGLAKHGFTKVTKTDDTLIVEIQD
ncbi:hypothetical protein A9Q87_06590 [Flavobacteriales bacterium 34_180_T64]|nr:hypothetical protein A9Q87_06590 [Flavobacteriales bacterium 34_180_T64]